MVRILLVDGQLLVSDALGQALGNLPDLEVVGTATQADDAIALACRHGPDLVLLDVELSGHLAFYAARAIQCKLPFVRVAFLAARICDSCIDDAVQIDAVGFIDKSETLESVVTGILQIARGGTYFSPSVRERLVVSPGPRPPSSKRQTRSSLLSPRELEVLGCIATGLSAKEVASVLHISERTVNNHRTNLMNKLDIHDRVALTRYALREGIASL